MTASLPTPLLAASTMPSTAWPATAASNALPPALRMRSAACVASGFIDAAAIERPRTTGRIVLVRTSSEGSCRPTVLGVFHQVEDRNGALPGEPRFEIANADADVEPQAGLGARAARRLDQMGGADLHVFAHAVQLVGARHPFVKDAFGNLDETWMRHPG